MNYIISPEQLKVFIKKIYGPLKKVSSDDGRYVVWYNKDGEKLFELTGQGDISVKFSHYHLLFEFISPSDASERSTIAKVFREYLEELSGKENLYITTF